VTLPSEAARAARQTRPSASMSAHGIVRRGIDADSKGRLVIAEGQTVLLCDVLGALGPGSVTSSSISATSAALDKPADRSHFCALSKVSECVYLDVRICINVCEYV
jgi:hypothetical protein